MTAPRLWSCPSCLGAWETGPEVAAVFHACPMGNGGPPGFRFTPPTFEEIREYQRARLRSALFDTFTPAPPQVRAVRACLSCLYEFEPATRGQIYCSKSCAMRHYRAETPS